jgi:hypothetical protein
MECRCLILILVKKAEKRKANDEPTDPETPRNKDLKYDREKRTRTFQNSWIDKFPWVVKCSRSFLPIILKIFISGSFRISWLVIRFPFFRFFD